MRGHLVNIRPRHFSLDKWQVSYAHYLEQTVHTSDGELEAGAAGTRRGLLLVQELLVHAHGALGTLA